MDLKDLSALDLARAIKRGEAGVKDAVKISLEQIKKRTVPCMLFWKQMRRKYMTE